MEAARAVAHSMQRVFPKQESGKLRQTFVFVTGTPRLTGNDPRNNNSKLE